MLTKSIIILLLLFAGGADSQEPCRCDKALKIANTCWGWAEHSPLDGGVVKEMRGFLVDPEKKPVADALVEVFDHPEAASGVQLSGSKKLRRVAACWIGADGEFCFKGLKPGRYEIRGSCVSGFDAGCTVVTLDPQNPDAKNNPILVKLYVSY